MGRRLRVLVLSLGIGLPVGGFSPSATAVGLAPTFYGSSALGGYIVPAAPDCIEAGCRLLGRFGCDDREEIRVVARSCQGNFDGGCLRWACEKAGAFACDDNEEVEVIGAACRGNQGPLCVASICDRLGRFACDDLNEISAVARSCGGR